MPNKPAVAVEIHDCYPEDWSPALLAAWGEEARDPAAWAAKAVAAGAELISLHCAPVTPTMVTAPRPTPWRPSRPSWAPSACR